MRIRAFLQKKFYLCERLRPDGVVKGRPDRVILFYLIGRIDIITSFYQMSHHWYSLIARASACCYVQRNTGRTGCPVFEQQIENSYARFTCCHVQTRGEGGIERIINGEIG